MNDTELLNYADRYRREFSSGSVEWRICYAATEGCGKLTLRDVLMLTKALDTGFAELDKQRAAHVQIETYQPTASV